MDGKKCGCCSFVGFDLLRCSRCKNIYYCSKKCQKEHWRLHKTSCVALTAPVPLVSLVNVENNQPVSFYTSKVVPRTIIPSGIQVEERDAFTGRGAFAVRSFAKGEMIFNEMPFIFCSQHYLQMEDDRQCNYCGRPAPFVLPTSSDRVPYKPFICRNLCSVVYCSSECEKRSYNQGHKILCLKEEKSGLTAPAKAAWVYLRNYCKKNEYRYPLMMAMVIAYYLASDKKTESWKHIWVPSLEMNDLQPKWEAEMGLLNNVFSLIPEARRFLKLDVYLNFCAMFRSNCIFVKTHGITSGKTEEEKLAVGNWCEGPGLFLFASLMNHSCLPKVQIHRTMNSATEFRAIEKIAEGEELTIDYLNITEEYGAIAWDTDINVLPEPIKLEIVERFVHRQTEMRENYLCFCACRLCKRDLPLSKNI